MKLRSVEETGENQTVILRMDLDLPTENGKVTDNSRLLKSLPTIKLLLERNNKIIIIGHMGRPDGKRVENLSLKPVYQELMGLVKVPGVFIDDITNNQKIREGLDNHKIVLGENLRFWSGEENNEPRFLETIKAVSQMFVNDAFAVAHRKSASVMLWQWMETYYGLSFVEEAEKIGKLVNNPEHPLTVILGGAKEDKLKYLSELVKIADKVLIGGKLPKIITEKDISLKTYKDKVIKADLNKNGLDLSDEDIKKFKEIIKSSKTIIWAGAMGIYENESERKGTHEVARAIAQTNAYKVIAGGDTGASIVSLGLKNKIDFICSGGGVMLEYLTKGTLPAWE